MVIDRTIGMAIWMPPMSNTIGFLSLHGMGDVGWGT